MSKSGSAPERLISPDASYAHTYRRALLKGSRDCYLQRAHGPTHTQCCSLAVRATAPAGPPGRSRRPPRPPRSCRGAPPPPRPPPSCHQTCQLLLPRATFSTQRARLHSCAITCRQTWTRVALDSFWKLCYTQTHVCQSTTKENKRTLARPKEVQPAIWSWALTSFLCAPAYSFQ